MIPYVRRMGFVVLSTTLLLGGCESSKSSSKSSGKEMKSGGVFANAPEWVRKGSGSFEGDRGRAIYGVGSRSNIDNIARLQDAAKNAARTEVAKVLNVKVTSLAKDYFRSVGTNDARQEEQLIQDVSKSYTEADLSGVQIVDMYHDPATKTMYSLAVMDLNLFKNITKDAAALKQEVKDYILKNADEAFKELDSMKGK
ncbi:MAG: LPP20 family lipoprotein [Planctomycetes bacterium]|nr:LPP20 family lipoprotein [Planctomycetota bacterium]